MEFSVLTYNTLFHRAFPHIKEIATTHRPDIICLQEIETNEGTLPPSIEDIYKLADYSNAFIKFDKVYGIATYYNSERLTLIKSDAFDLPRTFIEMLLVITRGVNNPRTILQTDFSFHKSNKNVSIFNTHLTPLYSMNGGRLKQLKEFMGQIKNSNYPIVVTGDFNFPYGRKKLEDLMQLHDLKEATNNILYTYQNKFFGLIPYRFKLDYILYKDLQLVKTDRLDQHFSDHFPILSKFTI